MSLKKQKSEIATRLMLAVSFFFFVLSSLQAIEPEWTGSGSHRIIVKVAPIQLDSGRNSDELVASYEVDFDTLKNELNITGQVDLSSLQVHKIDPVNGQAETFKSFSNAKSRYDRPCRFEDVSIPEYYPDRANYPSNYPNGQGPVSYRKRGGRLFNVIMDNSHGKIIWVHTQNAFKTSHYAIYWDTKESLSEIGPSPAPFIGDVDVLRTKSNTPLVGMAHLRICTGDLNGDGLFDIIAGEGKGNILFYPNVGIAGAPRFIGCKPFMDEKGPVNVGYHAAPFIYDWNNDGLVDLLAGTSHNVILWWKNCGTRIKPAFVYQGFLQADGEILRTPSTPCAEDPKQNIWKIDYMTAPCVCDWDNDGLPDILTGSYLTGQISYYGCIGRDSSGIPILTYKGPLKADGGIIDTGWCAAPVAYDFDNDNRLELITGSLNYGGEKNRNNLLMYYKNIGNNKEPLLKHKPLPKIGEFPLSNMARAGVADWNNDGLVDLIVSTGGEIYVYLNEGTDRSPTWRIDTTALKAEWGFQKSLLGSAMSLDDYNNDGKLEILSGTKILTINGSPYSPNSTSLGNAHVNGKPIWHEGPNYGDGYNWNIFADWDEDGLVDILSGTQQGNIYLHTNPGLPDKLSFNAGVKLKLINGEDLKIGPDVYEKKEDVPDFQSLQGARVKMLCFDVDLDGIKDLVMSDTYGQIWAFRNTGAGAINKIEPGILIGKGVSRLPIDTIDWNKDGKLDVVCACPLDNPGSIYLNESTTGNIVFAEPIQPMGMPSLFYNAAFHNIDWNSDGDKDLIINAEHFTFWAEDSFIRHGYQQAERVKQEKHTKIQ
ncbi:MAG: VCBS repeat-containing protein [Pirellulales bacterium]|nr:VCBS repeat-containing protein [Pirellulales bacterium]